MITFLIGFILGYIWYPIFKSIRVFILMYKIDKTMKSVYKEYDEIREIFDEVDKDWKEKNG